MTEEKQEHIMYYCTCAGEDPETAAMPFVMAVAALAMDIKATVVLQGKGVYLALEGYRKNMQPSGGFPTIDKLVKDFLDLEGELLVCNPCIKDRNILESELAKGSKITAAGVLNIAALKADAVFVY